MNKAESILKYLLENLEEGIHIVDNEGKTIYYNQAMGKHAIGID
jgi:arginine utilization regulatory protein